MKKTYTEFSTLGDLLVKAAQQYHDSDMLIFPERRVTYTQMHDMAYRRARALVAAGLRPGCHVGILMANCIEYVEYLMAVQLIGGMAVPINARYKASELAYVLENADIDLVVTHDQISEYANFARLIQEALVEKRGPRLQHLVMIGEATDGFVDDAAFLESGESVSIDQVDEYRVGVSVRQPAIMMYTSGTTANPKGCPLNHEVLVRNGINMNRSRYFLESNDRFWAPLPLFHMAAILPLMCCMDAGAAMLSMTYFEPGLSLKMMEEEKVTVAFPSFPTIMQDLLNHPDFEKTDLSNLRRLNNVAPPDLLQRFQDALPQAVQTGAYGLTEAGGVIAFNHPDESLEQRLHTCGKPMPGLLAKIVDPDTLEEKPAGEQGEILLKGYAVFDGYYKAVEKNQEAFADGWFRTGDLCAIDADGGIEFHGRIKDMLKVGGENVAALEIESFLLTHPSVIMAQVIGVPDDRLSEVACAYIELHDDESMTAEDLIAFCKGKISSFKIPRHVRFISEWPMSSTKIQKFVLRENFSEAAGT
ncbi:MAG: acyl--CoA ligase [Gammaproteobacteria bacterium]|jgi:acyl-CoA synthetase (AMP-forming)/AMP-acid ligase II|nr:acyl--CoA ligase [Gammaproteobacteria bacterium]MBT4381285.1 acyl--CoA ligase [Gammaproteobacteria bacterium]MBT4614818.1 acyl--CoA ligase [Gammaproteobacteria bacterium]MBT5198399.1 acyl--CoA ligase [Gammaproteobacteria bacterium]MBT6573315.1 acyl--CoA ligase [Gammaproteobacteria bacterium]